MVNVGARLQRDRGDRPLAATLCGALLVVLAVICVLLGFWGLISTQAGSASTSPVSPVGYDSEQASAGIGWFWLVLAVLDGVAAVNLLRGSRRSPAWSLGLSLVSIASTLSVLDGLKFPDWDAVYNQSKDTPLQVVLHTLTLGRWSTWLLIPALLIGIKLTQALLFDLDVRGWFGLPLVDDSGYGLQVPSGSTRERLSFWARLCFPAAILFLLWNGWATILMPISDFVIWREGGFDYWAVEYWVAGYGLVSLPFLAAIGFVVWRLGERVVVDDSGVRLFFFGVKYSALHAPWSRVKSVQVVRHRRNKPAAIIRYRSRFLAPASFRLAQGRFTNGETLIDDVLDQARRHGLIVQESYSPDWMPRLGWAVILIGVALTAGGQLYASHLYSQFSVENFQVDRFDRIAGIFPLTALHLASVSVVSVGLGMLSAHRRGSSSTVMLCAWMCSLEVIPGPLLHWLVWCAIFSILCAIQTPAPGTATPVPTMPSLHAWDLALNALLLAPVFAALGYWAGIVLGRRRKAPVVA